MWVVDGDRYQNVIFRTAKCQILLFVIFLSFRLGCIFKQTTVLQVLSDECEPVSVSRQMLEPMLYKVDASRLGRRRRPT
jgi:hypothetical protein